MRIWTAWVVLAAVGAVLLRCLFLADYPFVALDEGFWSVEAKDTLRFGQADMNGLYQYLRSPLHHVATVAWGWLTSPEVYGIRCLMVLAGLATTWVAARVAVEEINVTAGRHLVVLASFSFCLVMISRRAYLESMVGLLSVLAFWLSCRRTGRAMMLLALAVAALLLYKLNAIYLLPALMLPAKGGCSWQNGKGRLAAVLGGVALAGLVFGMLYLLKPAGMEMVWRYELTKRLDQPAWWQVGRFGIYPLALSSTAQVLVKALPDLVACIVAALVVLMVRVGRWTGLEWKLGLWLVGGLVFLLAQPFQHAQYFVPLAWPALLLLVRGVPRPAISALMMLMILSTSTRFVRGVELARQGNPLEEVAQHLRQSVPAEAVLLAAPEVCVMTPHRAYLANKHPDPFQGEEVKQIQERVARLGLTHIVLTPEKVSMGEGMFARPMSDYLASLPVVEVGTGTRVYQVPRSGEAGEQQE